MKRSFFTVVALFLIPFRLGAVTDEIGREVALPSKVERIVSMAPNITEILFALGVGDRLVGVTDYCNYPPEVEGKERIGGFVNPNLEAIVQLEPDLVIATADGNPRDRILQLERLGIPVFVIAPASLSEMLVTIRHLGTLLGVEAEAGFLIGRLEHRIEAIRKRIGDRPPVTTFLVVAVDPLMTASDQTILGSLLDAAGGLNVAADSVIRYPHYGWEALLLADPEVLVFAGEGLPDLSSARWQRLSAVQNRRVCSIPSDLLERPGPRLVEGLELLTQCLHGKEDRS